MSYFFPSYFVHIYVQCIVYLCIWCTHCVCIQYTTLSGSQFCFLLYSYIHGCGTFISTWKVQCQVSFCLVEVFHSVRTFTGSTHTRVSRIKLVLYLKIRPPTKRTVRLFRMSDSFRIRISCDKVSYLGNDYFPPLVQHTV